MIINLAAPVEKVEDLNGFDHGPLCGGQRDIMRKSTLPEINVGLGYYAYCDLKRFENLSSAPSYIRDIKDSGRQICGFQTLKNFKRREIMRNILCKMLWSMPFTQIQATKK